VNDKDIHRLLESLAGGELDVKTALAKLQAAFRPDNGVDDLGFARLDTDRQRRTGMAEVIFGPGKTEEQIATLIDRSLVHHESVLVTRVDEEVAQRLLKQFPRLQHNAIGRLLRVTRKDRPRHQPVAVVSAGTSDQPVAEEAATVLEHFGHPVDRIVDVGVAGIHRLFGVLERLRQVRALVVVAGMEGALPSVVAGLVQQPVIAVPTSVGYGASFGGLAALLGMLNSCAGGIGVVNIDNGFGAATLVHRIARTDPAAPTDSSNPNHQKAEDSR